MKIHVIVIFMMTLLLMTGCAAKIRVKNGGTSTIPLYPLVLNNADFSGMTLDPGVTTGYKKCKKGVFKVNNITIKDNEGDTYRIRAGKYTYTIDYTTGKRTIAHGICNGDIIQDEGATPLE